MNSKSPLKEVKTVNALLRPLQTDLSKYLYTSIRKCIQTGILCIHSLKRAARQSSCYMGT
jgi:hypothetical protein